MRPTLLALLAVTILSRGVAAGPQDGDPEFRRAPALSQSLPGELSATDAPSNKDAPTPAQRKLDSRLRDEIARRSSGVPLPVRAALHRVEIDDKERALVEIRARLLTQLGWRVERLKGTVVSSSLEYRSMVAWVPLAKLEMLAADTTVKAIAPAPKSTNLRSQGR